MPSPNLPYSIGEMPFGVGTPPPRKVRSNKGKKRKPNVVRNSNGDAVHNIISHSPIPKQYAITVQKQTYDARQLVKWFGSSKSATLPHTREKLDKVSQLMIFYRAVGGRTIMKLNNQKYLNFLNNPNVTWRPRPPALLFANTKSLRFFIFANTMLELLFLQDFMNASSVYDKQKVMMHPLPKSSKYSKKADIEFLQFLEGERIVAMRNFRKPPIIVN